MKSKVLIGASVLAAIAASSCCLLPIAFALLGAGVTGASAFFAAWRPELLGLAFGLLGLAFYFAYRRPRADCSQDKCRELELSRRKRAWLWATTAVVLSIAGFPYYSAGVAEFLLFRNSGSVQESRPGARQSRTKVLLEGQACALHTKSIENRLNALNGVKEAVVSRGASEAEIEFDPDVATPADFEQSIRDEGCEMRPTPEQTTGSGRLPSTRTHDSKL